MAKVYINGAGCVSAQQTFDSDFLENAVVNTSDNVLPIVAPPYKDYIAPAMIRRTAKGVKNGIVASALAMKEANVEVPDAIITGTGMGCIEDSDKFLKALIDNNEEFLTPTSFIQSTHNTVGSQIALGMQCKGYNFTYVNAAVSFESAVLDAKMQIESGEESTILIGGVDEMSHYTAKLFELAGFIKKESDLSADMLRSETSGAVYSEGATFFVLQDKKTDTSYAEIVDVAIVNKLSESEVESKILDFLSDNDLQISDLDAVVLGYNGDVDFDGYYKNLSGKLFQNTPQLYYKHLSGEYNTASAFGLWIGAKILKNQQIPAVLKADNLEKPSYKNILLYNQYKGIDHSFTLICAC